MRLSGIVALAFVVASAGPLSASPALAAPPECALLIELADWGENPTGDVSIASGESCQFSIKMRGTVTYSDILQ